jgi:hypothetical protein
MERLRRYWKGDRGMTTAPTGRFGSILQKIKEKPGEGSDEFDPKLEESEAVSQQPAPQAKKKRKVSKKNDPEYTQTTAYIRAKVYDETRKKLIDEKRKRDYSDLVNDLLAKWLASKKSSLDI